MDEDTFHRDTLYSPPSDYDRLTRIPLRAALPWAMALVLAVPAMAAFQTPLIRAEVLGQWLAPARVAQIDIHLHHAFSGVRPGDADLALQSPEWDDSAASRVRIDQGSFALQLPVRGQGDYTLAWHWIVPPGSPVLLWRCGHARPPDGLAPAHVAPLADLPAEWLPPICRKLP